ncbi:MAG: hypothetical protein A2W25_16445 [candidate division Zixibacteria bacterium RBG_16_53_22]|nr:MAG: hypothetical protein A2W25_16445 [candidate division Zixibacteria bacterium RBG_16_53_22]
MNITIETRSYNDRRYGKPYIAVIDFTDPKDTPTWGDWIGQPGSAGVLSIDALRHQSGSIQDMESGTDRASGKSTRWIFAGRITSRNRTARRGGMI